MEERNREKKLRLAAADRLPGCYPRGTYRQDMVYTFYQYKDFQAVWDRGRYHIQDELADRMEADGQISEEQKRRYERCVHAFVSNPAQYDFWPVEQIYAAIHEIRRQVFGERALEEERDRRTERGDVWKIRRQEAKNKRGGIDQSRKKQKLLEHTWSVLFILSEPEYVPHLR